MATSLLALLDDITSVLDDVATLTKIATKKTAGVLGDDLALNAQQVTGLNADRELPVVWAVARGSLVNKAILVPGALLISWLAPWGITPLLIVGGLFLCYEGAEKILHALLRSEEEKQAERARLVEALADPNVDLVALEKDKIKGAIRTDFILSAEIIVITLGSVANAALPTRIAVMVGIGLLMTVGVYGIVAAIVKLDDGGLALTRTRSAVLRAAGRGLLTATPWLMKGLSIAGTVAMFLVGGGMLTHGVPALHHLLEWVLHGANGLAASLGTLLFDGVAGLLSGTVLVLAMKLLQRVRGAPAAH